MLCCAPLRWMVGAVVYTPPLSIGRVYGTVLQDRHKDRRPPFLPVSIASFTRPVFIRQLVSIQLTAIEPGIDVHGGRNVGQEGRLERSGVSTVQTN